MKTLHQPQPCKVLLEPDEAGGFWVSAVRFRGASWQTKITLEVWTYWGEWWLDPKLEGESRVHYVLGTQRGEICVFYRISPQVTETGWYVAGWYD